MQRYNKFLSITLYPMIIECRMLWLIYIKESVCGAVPGGFGVGGVEGREAGLGDVNCQAAVPGDVEAVVVGRHEVDCGGGIFHRFGDCGADFRCPVGREFAEIFFEVEEQRIIVAVEPLHCFQFFFIEWSCLADDLRY